MLPDVPQGREAVREDLLKTLASYEPKNEKERDDVTRIAMFLREHEEFLGKANPIGHVTGSAYVTDPAGERLLLLHHGKLHRWLQPGGHTDPDEHPATGAIREAHEETGLALESLSFLHGNAAPIDVDIHVFPERNGEPAHDHMDFRYAVVANDPESFSHSYESTDIRWFAWHELAASGFDASGQRAAAKARHLISEIKKVRP